jgi:hypothetical protein
MCQRDREDGVISLVQVLPATWNGFNNFTEVCDECQTSRRFKIWAKSIKPAAKAPVAAGGVAAPISATPDPSGAPVSISLQIAHRRTRTTR